MHCLIQHVFSSRHWWMYCRCLDPAPALLMHSRLRTWEAALHLTGRLGPSQMNWLARLDIMSCLESPLVFDLCSGGHGSYYIRPPAGLTCRVLYQWSLTQSVQQGLDGHPACLHNIKLYGAKAIIQTNRSNPLSSCMMIERAWTWVIVHCLLSSRRHKEREAASSSKFFLLAHV